MVRRITPEEALSLVREEGYVYVDVRSAMEFEQGHPTGAYNLPLLDMGPTGMEPNPSFLEDFARAFPDKSAGIILSCKSGGRSLRAAGLLEGAGYRNVLDQKAGFDGARDAFGRVMEEGWRSRGLPVSTEADPGKSYAELKG